MNYQNQVGEFKEMYSLESDFRQSHFKNFLSSNTYIIIYITKI